MAKLEYATPRMSEEVFAADEYVAACLKLYCAIPGKNSHACFDGTDVVGEYQVDNRKANPKGNLHGTCAYGNSYSAEIAKNVEIYDVSIGDGADQWVNNLSGSIGTPRSINNIDPDKYYRATWKSAYEGNTYNHYGLAQVDGSSPNHS